VFTANRADFKCPSAYFRPYGLTEDVLKNGRYTRCARMLYHTLADQVVPQRNPTLRSIYDKCQADTAGKNPSYTKSHIQIGASHKTVPLS
jgi:hypothetical protein